MVINDDGTKDTVLCILEIEKPFFGGKQETFSMITLWNLLCSEVKNKYLCTNTYAHKGDKILT